MINPGVSCGRCPACLAGEEPLCRDYAILGEHRPGTAAELVVVPAENVAPVPDGMPWPQAAAFSLSTLTAWRMLTGRAGLRAGGDGARSGASVAAWRMAALQIASAARRPGDRDQRRPTPSSSSPADWGPPSTLNHAHATTWSPRCGGSPAGAAPTSWWIPWASETWSDSLRALRRGGRLVVCGATTGPRARSISGGSSGANGVSWARPWAAGGSTRRSCAGAPGPALAGGGSGGAARAAAPKRIARMQRGEQTGKLVIEVSP